MLPDLKCFRVNSPTFRLDPPFPVGLLHVERRGRRLRRRSGRLKLVVVSLRNHKVPVVLEPGLVLREIRELPFDRRAAIVEFHLVANQVAWARIGSKEKIPVIQVHGADVRTQRLDQGGGKRRYATVPDACGELKRR